MVCVVLASPRSVHDSRNAIKFVPNQLSGADYSVTNNYIHYNSERAKWKVEGIIMIVANPKEATNINEYQSVETTITESTWRTIHRLSR